MFLWRSKGEGGELFFGLAKAGPEDPIGVKGRPQGGLTRRKASPEGKGLKGGGEGGGVVASGKS